MTTWFTISFMILFFMGVIFMIIGFLQSESKNEEFYIDNKDFK